MPNIGHKSGDHGQLVITWIMSSQLLEVTVPPLPAAWSFGDISFIFSFSAPALAAIVLSGIDTRYFRDIARRAKWSLHFVPVKEGQREPVAEVPHSEFHLRSVSLEKELEAGNYTLCVRLDRTIKSNETESTVDETQLKKLSRVVSARAESFYSLNFSMEEYSKHLPADFETAIEDDFAQLAKMHDDGAEVVHPKAKEESKDKSDSAAATTSTKTVEETEKVEKGKVLLPLSDHHSLCPVEGIHQERCSVQGCGKVERRGCEGR
ncbi:hypothetical protein BKA70DRAFT_294802 [Coprinopsis sp. MPI-PUGE-AT-0042]|nr:hypothetical protein BKA70DRAFT_294802 [Coprinopsis sp. MPI-PUGE-AT-0042]